MKDMAIVLVLAGAMASRMVAIPACGGAAQATISAPVTAKAGQSTDADLPELARRRMAAAQR